MDTLRQDAMTIVNEAIRSAMPGRAVQSALRNLPSFAGKLILVSVGKAAWEMANTAHDVLKDRISCGIVITKYGHAKGTIGKLRIFEAGHPVPDENGFAATEQALSMVQNLSSDDLVLFLLSGGGSALFEKPLISAQALTVITQALLFSGAAITEINTVRKHLSAVKGGRFALACAPANIYSVVLSDVLGDPLDVIASGPAYPDQTTAEDALAICDKYHIALSDEARSVMRNETPKALHNVVTNVSGSVKQLCASAEQTCAKLGYKPQVLTTSLCCEARDAGRSLAIIAKENMNAGESLAFIMGGETVVHVTGKGLGGRNQEISLSAADGIAGLNGVCVFSVGSDGTDGPTDAAGGYADGETKEKLRKGGIDIQAALQDNDAYHALQAVDGLMMTGPTGTNVNDLTVLLIRR